MQGPTRQQGKGWASTRPPSCAVPSNSMKKLLRYLSPSLLFLFVSPSMPFLSPPPPSLLLTESLSCVGSRIQRTSCSGTSPLFFSSMPYPHEPLKNDNASSSCTFSSSLTPFLTVGGCAISHGTLELESPFFYSFPCLSRSLTILSSFISYPPSSSFFTSDGLAVLEITLGIVSTLLFAPLFFPLSPPPYPRLLPPPLPSPSSLPLSLLPSPPLSLCYLSPSPLYPPHIFHRIS